MAEGVPLVPSPRLRGEGAGRWMRGNAKDDAPFKSSYAPTSG